MSGYALLVGFIPRKVAGDLSAALSTLATSLPRKATGWRTPIPIGVHLPITARPQARLEWEPRSCFPKQEQ